VDPLEAWAAANPAGRDALLDLAEQGVALQPAAEVVIQLAHLDQGSPPTDHVAEQERVEGAYQALLARLGALRLDRVASEPLAALLERHAALVAGARAGPRPPDGLGRVAGDLVALRDRIRRTVPVKGRAVVTHVTKRL
jgi:hypothetical protein